MRALVFEGPGSIGFTHDGVEPDLQADSDALVRVSTAGLCGSDLHPSLGREPLAPGTVPGHEAVGLVEAAPSENDDPKPYVSDKASGGAKGL